MQNLNAIAIFVDVGETLSFTHTAARLGLTASGVGKAITRLEADLGVRLLNRSTRKLSLTPEGANFFARCRTSLSDLKAAEADLISDGNDAHGRLRVQLPVVFGRRVIVPKLAEFAERYRHIVLDVELSDRKIDLSDGMADVVVRGGELADSRVVARKLCDVPFLVCASADYLRRHGEPMTLEDLQHHQCIGHFMPESGKYRGWTFEVDGQERSLSVAGQLNFNNAESAFDAVMAGAGIASLGKFLLGDAIRDGKLKPILLDYPVVKPAVSMIYMHSPAAPRIRISWIFCAKASNPIPPSFPACTKLATRGGS